MKGKGEVSGGRGEELHIIITSEHWVRAGVCHQTTIAP